MTISNYKNHQVPDYDHDRYDIPLVDSIKKIIDSKPVFLVPLVFDDGAGNSWNIVEGDIRKGGGYSQAEWDQAYNNKTGIQAALEYASDNGFKTALLPRGHYNTLYTNPDGVTRSLVPGGGYGIVVPSNLTVNLNQSTISVIFDSDNRSPYDLGSDYIPSILPGNIFSVRQTYNSRIINGTLRGEMYERTWNDGANENWAEFTTGVYVSHGSVNMVCEGLDVRGFSGDSFSTATSHDPDLISTYNAEDFRNMDSGELNMSDGTIGVSTDAYTTGLTDIPTNKDELIMRTNIGYTRFPDFVNQRFGVAWYDSGDTFISSEFSYCLSLLQVPDNAAKMRVGIFGEVIGSVDTTKYRFRPSGAVDSTDYTVTVNNVDYTINSGVGSNETSIAIALVDELNTNSPLTVIRSATSIIIQTESEDVTQISCSSNVIQSVYRTYQITPPSPHHFTIRNCVIAENHRGGVSNVCNNTIIENCRFFENGLGAKQGWMQFPDTTRYQLNFEDTMSNHVVIRNNEFTDGANGLLIGGKVVIVEGNKIMNSSGVIVYHAYTSFIRNNVFENCTTALQFTDIDDVRKIYFESNRMINTNDILDTSLSVGAVNTKVFLRSNFSESSSFKCSIDDAHDIEIRDIDYIETPNTKDLYNGGELKGLVNNSTLHFKENQFSTARVYFGTKKGSNYTVKCDDPNKRLSNVNDKDVYGLNLTGGKFYRELSRSGAETFLFEDCKLGMDRFEFNQYGDLVDSNYVFNFNNCEITPNGGFTQLFYMMTNSSNGTGDLTFNFTNCKFTYNTGIGGDIFYFAYLGAGHNITVNLTDTEIDLSNTSETVNLCRRFPGYANDVQINYNNVTITGTLNTDDAGHTITDNTPTPVASTSEDKGAYLIVPSDYGIIEGDIRKGGGYSQAEWDQAYNNMNGLQNALNYAASNGYTTAVLPKEKHFNILYTNESGDIRTNLGVRNHCIIMPSNLIFDLNQSTISMLWDSDVRNPYDNGPDYDPHQLPGHTIAFSRTHNSKVINGKLRGEMYERSWVNAGENSQELNTGVWVEKGSSYNVADSLDVRGYSGDSFSTFTNHDDNFGNYLSFTPSRTLYPDYLDIDDGTTSSRDGAYTTALLDISGITSESIIMRTNIGFKRTPEFVSQVFNICWYDVNGDFISGENSKFLKLMKVPQGATQIRIGIYGDVDNNIDTDTIRIKIDSVVDSTDYTITINGTDYTINSGVGATTDSVADALRDSINAGTVFKGVTASGDVLQLGDPEDGEGLETLTIDTNMSRYVYKTYQITPPTPHHFTISNCVISENHRGGVSNVCNNTIIENCRFFDNGLGHKQGWPQFPDTTRYQINFEDVIPNSVIIRDNEFNDSFNGVLASGHRVDFYNNKIMNSSGLSVFHAENLYAHNNVFINCTRAFGAYGSTSKRVAHFYDNTIYDTQFSDTYSDENSNTYMHIKNNIVHSDWAFYRVNPAYAKLSPFISIIHYETYYNGTTAAYNKMNGIFKDCEFYLTEPRVSTSYIELTSYEGSNFLIQCTHDNKRITPLDTIYGLTMDGGALYRGILKNETRTFDFYDCKLDVDTMEFNEYGTDSESNSTHVFNFNNCIISKKTTGRIFKSATNTSDGTTNVTVNIIGGTIKYNDGVGGEIFHFGHVGANHNVTINLTDVTIDTSDTSESVTIGIRSSGWVNPVQVNKTNVKVIGSLNEVADGFNVTSTTNILDDVIINDNGSIGIGDQNPSSKLEITGEIQQASNNSKVLALGQDSDGGVDVDFKNSIGTLGKVTMSVESPGAGTDDGVFTVETSLNGALSEKLRVNSSGNVGIGVSAPVNKLDILNEAIGNGNKQNNALALCYNATTTYAQHYMDANGIYNIESINDGAAGGNLQLRADDTLRFVTNATEAIRVDANGNVGINESTGLGAKVTIKDRSRTAGEPGSLQIKGGGTSELALGVEDGHAWIQSHGSSPLYINELGLDVISNLAGGCFVIGKETPNAKLDVDGGVKVGNDSDVASADKEGTFRYRSDANNSYVEVCMKTGASTYAWEIISQKTF
jgi:hypothetical protein